MHKLLLGVYVIYIVLVLSQPCNTKISYGKLIYKASFDFYYLFMNEDNNDEYVEKGQPYHTWF